MTTVASLEAKTRLAELLQRVATGERFLITDLDKPVAMLVPAEAAVERTSAEVGRAMLAYRDQAKRVLDGSFRDLAHEGHTR